MGKRIRNIYFTSDFHVGHDNVLIFDNRPFKDMDHMCEGLIKRYNAIVREEDVGYFLGDMGWAGDRLKKVMDRLNGTKILILGNHDKKQQAMMNSGFDAVMYSASMYIQNELVTMTHCPLRGVFREDTKGMRHSDGTENWHKENKHIQFSIEDQGQFHLHGHIHSPNGGKSEKLLGRQMDVGVVAWGYRPVSISEIESWIFITKRNEKVDSKRRSGKEEHLAKLKFDLVDMELEAVIKMGDRRVENSPKKIVNKYLVPKKDDDE